MAVNSNITIRKATKADVPVIQELANKTWPLTYREILTTKQLEYMLELIYSEAALKKQFDAGHNFIIAKDGEQPIAFADYSLLRDEVYKLHKIYVLPEQQGKGLGKLLMDHVIEKVKEKNGASLLLNVNRNNKAKQVYEHLGFKVIGEEDIDIGEGYFMNDYVMEKKLA